MGVLGMVMPIYQLILTIVTLGLPTVLARFVALDLSRGNTEGIEENRRSCVLLIFILAVGMALGIFIFATDISSLLYKDHRTGVVLRFLAPLLILTSLTLIYRGYYRGLGHTIPLAGSEICGVLGETIYVVHRLSTIPALTTEKGINLVMIGSVFGETITVLILILWDKYRKKQRPMVYPKSGAPKKSSRGPSRTDETQLGHRRLLRNSLPLLMQDLIYAVSGLAEGILLPRLLMLSGLTAIQATQSAGFYWGLTQPLYFIPLVFLFPLTTIILPATARAGTGEEALRRFWRKGRKLLALVFVYGVFSVLLLSFFGDEIAGILFNSTGSNRLLLMILPALPFSAINPLLSTMIEGLGKQGFLYQATLLAILIKTAVTTALVPLPGYRITGAAWGFLVSQIAYTLFLNGKMFRLGLGYSKILNKRRVTGIFRKTPPHHS